MIVDKIFFRTYERCCYILSRVSVSATLPDFVISSSDLTNIQILLPISYTSEHGVEFVFSSLRQTRLRLSRPAVIGTMPRKDNCSPCAIHADGLFPGFGA